MTARILFALPIVFGFVLACSAEVPPADPASDENDVTPTPSAKNTVAPPPDGGSAEAAAPSCPYTGPPVDVSSFAVCRTAGRCIPDTLVPDGNKEQFAALATCDAKGSPGHCAPEKIVANAGMYLPPSCHGLGGEGRCISLVIPQIDEQKDHLPQDTCGTDERCAPCFDPLTGKETGACRSVSCDAPKEQAKPFPQCCSTKGRCVPTSSMTEDQSSQLEQKECAATEVCAPAENMDPKFVPTKCQASAFIGSYDGVCISNCVHKGFLTSLGTAQGNCDADHFCAPCNNPLTGEPTGAPGCK